MKLTNITRILTILAIGGSSAACADDEDTAQQVPDSYVFESRFQKDVSSVSYSGQTLRHILIADLTTYIGSLQEAIETDAGFDPSKVEDALLSYYEFDSDTLGGNSILLTTDPETLQEVYDDVSADKNLVDKMAGQDGNDHEDWSEEFVGWKDDSIAEHGGSIDTPDGLLRAFLATIAENARLQVDGDESRDGLATHQSPQGWDLAQLTQKFLLGAVAFSQGADDYLDEGLENDNSESDEGAPYTALEHAWDEGFGYFGASRFYLAQSDEEIAEGELLDEDGDDSIDLLSEYNFGASVNAAKRDTGSTTGTTFSEQAMGAFLRGRALISAEAELSEIEEQAEVAVLAWEKSLAATAVHYINDTLGDMEDMDSDDYSFADHAKHWSELKGFALGFQFNPRSPLKDSEFEELHELIADAPVLEDADEDERDDYAADLLEARELLQRAYDFETEDVENW